MFRRSLNLGCSNESQPEASVLKLQFLARLTIYSRETLGKNTACHNTLLLGESSRRQRRTLGEGAKTQSFLVFSLPSRKRLTLPEGGCSKVCNFQEREQGISAAPR
jgi:hypothetical protein